MNWTERFQVTVPAKEEAGEAWADLKRRVHPQTQLEMPPGYDAQGPVDSFENVVAGQNDPTNVRLNLLSDKNLQRGYGKGKMAGTDDQYTGEHADQFYGDAGGFVERNNYLDRE